MSYVVKTSTGKKNVLMLTTTEPILGITRDDKRDKLGTYKLYDFTKGGTDIVDQRMGFLTCKTKSRKWTMVAFAYVLDMARVNSATIHALNKNEDPQKGDSFKFGFDLVMQLVKPFIEQRSTQRLSWLIKSKISLILGRQPQPQPINNELGPSMSEKRGRCVACLKGILGENYLNRRKHISSNRSICQVCGNYTCKEHLVQKCETCNTK